MFWILDLMNGYVCICARLRIVKIVYCENCELCIVRCCRERGSKMDTAKQPADSSDGKDEDRKRRLQTQRNARKEW